MVIIFTQERLTSYVAKQVVAILQTTYIRNRF